MNFINDCLKNLNEDTKSSSKLELIAQLNEKKHQLQLSTKAHSRKSQAPKPPPRFDDNSPNGLSPSFDLRPLVSQQNLNDEKEHVKTTMIVTKGRYCIVII